MTWARWNESIGLMTNGSAMASGIEFVDQRAQFALAMDPNEPSVLYVAGPEVLLVGPTNPMMRSGKIGDFLWVELPTDHFDIPTVVRHLARQIIGLTAVNVSWDSGHMVPTSAQERAGWHRAGELAVSPVVDDTLVSDWPASSCNGGRFDEWYFFRNIEGALKLDAFCNYGGMSLEDAPALAFPDGLDLKAQLERYRPEIVIGDGKHLFVISVRPEIIEMVAALDEV